MKGHTNRMTSKRSYHHGNLKASLLDAAIPLLAEKGVVGLSLREVAKRAGVSHAAPYRHFKDKQALLEALAITGYEFIRTSCEQAVADNPSNPRQQLVDAGTAYLLYVSRQREITHLMFSGELSTEGSSAEVEQAAKLAFSALEAIIQNGIDAGLYNDFEAHEMALAALSTVHGLSMLIASSLLHKNPDTATIKATGKRIASILLQGIEKT